MHTRSIALTTGRSNATVARPAFVRPKYTHVRRFAGLLPRSAAKIITRFRLRVANLDKNDYFCTHKGSLSKRFFGSTAHLAHTAPHKRGHRPPRPPHHKSAHNPVQLRDCQTHGQSRRIESDTPNRPSPPPSPNFC